MQRQSGLPAGTLIAGLVTCLMLAAGAVDTRAAQDLKQAFLNPPDSARPWVYWFWLNGNITREGITADLEAMKRVGIGGVLIMEVDQGAPVGPADFMGEKWRELFKHVVSEASRLGLEVNMNNDAGWNGSGGPWIRPEQSMQRVVWTELDAKGGRRVEKLLPQPQMTAGFYRDIAVLAFPVTGPYRIENIKPKSFHDMGGPGTPIPSTVADKDIVDRDKVVDVTKYMDATGRLVWDAPPGKWTIVRFGHTSTGVENAPAPKTGRGLECDKLSKEGIEANFAGMMAKLVADVGPGAGKTLVTTHIDSWENGAQNWTTRMREEFKARRGYDLTPYLPVIGGRVVGSPEISERFLWDLRRTVSDLVVEHYAGHMAELAHKSGLRLSIEAYGSPTDDLPYAGRADEPMAEFWVGGGAMETARLMASAAHTYGKPIVGAEAFTAADQEKWLEHPASVKGLGDEAFCNGINRFVFHRYAMQPWLDRKPGMTMGPWGLHYERTQTWWKWSGPWHQYLARCQYLLRQGLFVADICYLQPEAAPQGSANRPPQPYEFDDCSAEVVLTRMIVKDGRLALPDGMSYRVLVLPEAPMTPLLLQKIGQLVKAGATVLGAPPQKSPSLANYPKCDDEVKALAKEIWGDCDGKSVTEHRLGQGRVVQGLSPEQVLAELKVPRDFTGRGLRYIHRAGADADLYFVSNPQRRAVEAGCTFRVSGRLAELWWPDTGRIDAAPVSAEENGVTRVLLSLPPSGSVFVVFRKDTKPADTAVALDRDGNPVFSLSAAGPKITVRKAAYGIPKDAQLTRDVRDLVQQMVDMGETSFAVATVAKAGDPAFGKVKTLTVEYQLDDRMFTATGKDQDVIHLTGAAPKITIEKATYGVPGDAQRTRDVKAKLQRLVDTGLSSVQVSKMAAGDDPAYMVVKTLTVQYTVEGKHLSATGQDGNTLELAPPPAAADAVARLQTNPDGRLLLEAYKPGRYEVTSSSGGKQKIEVASLTEPIDVSDTWKVSFAADCDAPPAISLDRLASLSVHADSRVKYFSGTATYTKTLQIQPEQIGRYRKLYLDLGNVQVMAEVAINGKSLGVLWKPPYRIDITDTAKAGDNALEVKVANLWPNRMVGDEQLPEDSDRNPNGTLRQWPEWLAQGKAGPTGRCTFTSWRLWRKDSPLPESGLIGPVTLRAAAVVEVPR